MKNTYVILLFLGIFISIKGYSQLRVAPDGKVYIGYGVFSVNQPATLHLGDANHYIKSVFGSGVSIGTAGLTIPGVFLKQYIPYVGIYKTNPTCTLDVGGKCKATIFEGPVSTSNLLLLPNENECIQNESSTPFSLLRSKPSLQTQLINGVNNLRITANTINYNISNDNKNISDTVSSISLDINSLKINLPNCVTKTDEGKLAIKLDQIINAMIISIQNLTSKVNQLQDSVSGLIKNVEGNNYNEYRQSKFLDFFISPNPVKDEINMDIYGMEYSNSYALIIMDIFGNELFLKNIDSHSNKVSFNINGMKNGTYFYNVKVNNFFVRSSKKIIKI